MARNVVENSRRYRERHPERVRAANLGRNDYKREWESGECPECGDRISDVRRAVKCANCKFEAVRREAIDRTVRFIALRKEGLLNIEIAEREGVTTPVVNTVLSRASRYGLDAGRSPCFKAPA
jgi:predicted Zn-ribbon and HTH transcriptional regulator